LHILQAPVTIEGHQERFKKQTLSGGVRVEDSVAVKDPDRGIVVGVVGEDKNRSGGRGESVKALDRGDPVEGRHENMSRIQP
jgi:hypothetical protein